MVEYRRDYERRREQQEQRAGVLKNSYQFNIGSFYYPPKEILKENRFIKGYNKRHNNRRLVNVLQFKNERFNRKKNFSREEFSLKQRNYRHNQSKEALNIYEKKKDVSKQQLIKDYQKIVQDFNKNIKNFQGKDILKNFDHKNIYQIKPSEEILGKKEVSITFNTKNSKYNLKEKKNFRPFHHYFLKKCKEFQLDKMQENSILAKTNLSLPMENFLFAKNNYYGKKNFVNGDYKIQKLYYQNHSIQIGSVFSEPIFGGINIALLPTLSVVMPINRQRSRLQFYDAFQPFSKKIQHSRQYGLKTYSPHTLFKKSEQSIKFKNKTKFENDLNKAIKKLSNARIQEEQRLAELEIERKRQADIQIKLIQQAEKLLKAIIQTSQLKLHENNHKKGIRLLEYKQNKVRNSNFQTKYNPEHNSGIYENKFENEEHEMQRFTMGVTINPLYLKYFTSNHPSQFLKSRIKSSALFHIKNLRAKFKTYYKRRKRTL